LRHQDVETSVQGTVRKCADEEAATIMRRCTDGYKYRHYYRPYLLLRPKFANGYTGGGISVDDLLESDCKLVTDLV